jgi:hypothetical protein
MRGMLRDAKSEAQSSMRKAESFWDIIELTVHRIRYAASMKAHYEWLLRVESRHPRPRPRLLCLLKKMSDGAHDMGINESMNLATLAEQARGAEMMARIWDEERQDRPHGSPTEDWERYGRDE